MKLLFRWRWPLLGLTLVLGVLIAPYLKPALRIDNSLTAWFIQEDPALQSYYEFQEYFGNDELLILVYHRPEGLMEQEPLKRIQALSDSLPGLDGVARVYGPASAQVPERAALTTTTRPLLRDENIDPQKVRETLLEQDFLRGQFFREDLHTVRLLIKLENSPDFAQERGRILDDIKASSSHFLDPEHTYYGGVGIIYEALNDLSKQDFARFIGVGYLLMFVFIYLLYRRWYYVLYAVITVGVSTYFTLSIYGLLGFQLNLMTTLIPAIIILLCVMDVMHIINEYSQQDPRKSAKIRSIQALRVIGKPCLFTTFTTMAGFLTLAFTPIRILVTFGIFSALGIFLGLAFSILFGFFFLPAGRTPPAQRNTADRLQRWQDHVLSRPRRYSLIAGGLAIIAALGVSRINVDTNSAQYLPPDHPVRQDDRAIQAHWGPYMPLEFLIHPSDSLDLRSPQLLRSLIKLEESITKLEGVGAVTGYHDIYASALKNRYGEDWKKHFHKTTVLRNIGRQAEFLFPEIVRSFTTQDYHLGRLLLEGNLVSAAKLDATIDSIQDYQEQYLAPYARLEVSGYQSLYSKIVDYVTRAQVESLSIAAGIIFLLLWLFLRDFKLALLSLIPNLLPILVMLGFMGWTGIPLDTATACIASIVLSFSVDDTMHFSYYYRKLYRSGQRGPMALRNTVGHVGRAILYTSAVLFTGYSLMLFGSLRTVIYFGALASVAIVVALFSQLVIFPILLRRFHH